MNKDRLPKDFQRGWMAFQRTLRYGEEMLSSEVGRRSDTLRQQGHVLIRQGSIEEAIACFEEAAGLFPADDLSPAAAASWFDLAEALRKRVHGGHVENLKRAEELFRRALRSPAREQDPHRASLTRRQMASCLRHLALEPTEFWRYEMLLDEARTLLLQAIQLQEDHGPWGWEDTAGAYNNLGGLLQQRGRHRDATRVFEEGLRYARQLLELERQNPEFKRGMHSDGDKLVAQMSVNLARHLLDFDTDADQRPIERLLKQALELDVPAWQNVALIMLATYQLAKGGPNAEAQARNALEKLSWEELPHDFQRRAIDLLVRLKLRREALRCLSDAVVKCIETRHMARANHVADLHARRAQRFSNLLARVHAEEPGEALDAFLALERTAAYRFMESWFIHCWHYRSPIDRALHQEELSWSLQSAWLQECAGVLRHAPPTLQPALLTGYVKVVRASLEHPEEDITAVWREDFFPRELRMVDEEHLRTTLEQALLEKDSVGYLERQVEVCAERSLALQHLLARRNPEMAHKKRLQGQILNRADLEALLKQDSNTVLLRLSLDSDLLVVAVWLENGAVKAKARLIKLPDGWLQRMTRLHAQLQEEGHRALPETLEADLSALDLTRVLPEGHRARVVLLPSLVASWLPLAALGPRGRTLLDRFEEVIWLPSLDPLRVRPDTCPPRRGTLSIAPPGTHFHSLAFHGSHVDEERLTGSAATAKAVTRRAFYPDVVSFFTHAAPALADGVALQLADGPLEGHFLGARWEGLERIELWACQTGVNVPHDPLTPMHDEAFGLDIEFIKAGVRSAIGSLWKVPDFVTACIVRYYRQRLATGASAPRAFADAQRWWRDEGVTRLGALLEQHPSTTAVEIFIQSLGGAEAKPWPEDLAQLLGPVPFTETGAADTDIRSLLRMLSSPVSWAGLRFVGVHERRPLEPWTVDHYRPLTAEEREELNRLRSATPSPARQEGISLNTWQEQQLDQLTGRALEGAPGPALALEVARRYQSRIHSARSDNLRFALAWLHETLLQPGLSREEADTLRLEAMWLWLELATPECFLFPIGPFTPPDSVLLTRAERLLEQVPRTPVVRTARAWLRLLQTVAGPEGARPEFIVQAAEEGIEAALTISEPGINTLRALSVACELALGLKSFSKENTARLIQHIECHPIQESPSDHVFARHRLFHLLEMLKQVETRTIPVERVDVRLLSPRDMARANSLFHVQTNLSPGLDTMELTNLYDRTMSAMEGSVWGDLEDPETPVFRFTGTTGPAYRSMLGHYLEMKLWHEPQRRPALHYIAAIQGNADLHLKTRRRLARFVGHLMSSGRGLPAPAQEEAALTLRMFNTFLQASRIRAHLLLELKDAASLPELDIEESTPEDIRRHKMSMPSPLDPFACSSQAILEKPPEDAGRMIWTLASDAVHFSGTDAAGERSAAFQLVREVERMGHRIAGVSRGLVNAVQKADKVAMPEELRKWSQGLLDPGRNGKANEARLRHLPPDHIIVSVAPGRRYSLAFFAVWQLEGQTGGNEVLLEDEAGMSLRQALAAMFQPLAHWVDCQFDQTGERNRRWQEVCHRFMPVLERLLEPLRSLSRPLHFGIFAPGGLRAVPWLGIPVWGKPLYERALTFSHLLTIDANPLDMLFAPGRLSPTACLHTDLPAERAETAFGRAVVTSLNRWFPPRYDLSTMPHDGETIIEARALQEAGLEAGHVRLYSATPDGLIHPSLAGLWLPGNRGLRSMNLPSLLLPSCALVEIWADTAGMAPLHDVLFECTDRVPGLAHTFLEAGAENVLDLAWPVYDLIKALLCERFGILSRTTIPSPAAALPEALRSLGRLQETLRGTRDRLESVPQVLSWLDDARRTYARQNGQPLEGLVPFAPLANRPSLQRQSAATLIEELCQPVHLAALRMWSG